MISIQYFQFLLFSNQWGHNLFETRPTIRSVYARGMSGSGVQSVRPIVTLTTWSCSLGSKMLQILRFLGFVNLYRGFICNYSQTVSPLYALTSTKKTFIWKAEEEKFSNIKRKFSQVPILFKYKPFKKFILEVNASDSGVIAELLEKFKSWSNELHFWVFFSLRLLPTKPN